MTNNKEWYSQISHELECLLDRGYFYSQNPINFINSACWCGSGKKYRNCHYKALGMNPIKRSDCLRLLKKHKSQKFKCCFENCTENSIESHSIPSSWLLSIANESNFVYQIKRNLFRDLNDPSQHPFIVDKIGIFKSSTFKGFCKYHDNELFKEVEKRGGWELNDENCLILFYRSICFEIYRKTIALGIGEELKEYGARGIDPISQVDQFVSNAQYVLEIKKALEDLNNLKCKVETYLKKSYVGIISYTYIPIETPINLMANGIYYPLATFNGDDLQELSDDYLMAMSCIVGKNGAENFVLFVSIDNGDERARKFHEHLLSCDNLGNRIVTYLMESTENLFWRISHWDGLDDTSKNEVFRILSDSLVSDSLLYSQKEVLPSIEPFIVKESEISQKIV